MKKNIITLVISFIFLYAIRLLSLNENFVENIYSRKIYKFISSSVIKITEIVPFSLAEITIFIIIIFLILILLQYTSPYLIYFKKHPILTFLNTIYILIITAFIVYIIFMSIWGLNYYRKPLISYYKDTKIEEIDIIKLATILVDEANITRREVTSIDRESEDFNHLNNMVYESYKKVFEEYPFLETYYSRAKPIFISKIFTKMTVTGIFSPFTYEPNVNTYAPSVSIPYSIAHEVSHQIGIASEDEASFLAYIALSKSDNTKLRYSAAFDALLNTLSAIDKNNKSYERIVAKISDDVKKDMANYADFWSKYENTVISNTAEKVNDNYLRANNQADGVYTYSKVINLIVLYRLKNEKVDF